MKNWLFILVVSLVSVNGYSQQTSEVSMTAERHLALLADAVAKRNFKMTFVTMQSESQLNSYIWRKSHVDGDQMEHVSLLNGSNWEALRINNTVYYSNSQGTVAVDNGQITHPLPMNLLSEPQSLSASYDFVVLGKSRISGRTATKIRMVSKDNTRFTYTLWLDTKTHLLLQLVTHGLDGKLKEQLQITSLDILTQSDPFFTSLERANYPRTNSLDVAAAEVNLTGLKFTWLPEGMTPVLSVVKRMHGNMGSVRHIMMSDGLVDVSVYVNKLQKPLPKQGALAVGAENLLTLQKGQTEITIIGKIPLSTAERVIQSMQLGD